MDITALIAAYDVVDNALTTHVIRMRQIYQPLTKNSFVRFPPYFAEGIIGMTPKMLKISRKFDD